MAFAPGPCLLLAAVGLGLGNPTLGHAQLPNPWQDAFVNFESVPVHPIDLSSDQSTLAVCNLADGKLELLDVTTGTPVPLGSVAVGIDPVSARFRSATEIWVVNHISDSISVVDAATQRVVATLNTLDTPCDLVFAGSPLRAFVSCALPNRVQVFDAATRVHVTDVVIAAERPKALAVSGDGSKVYAAIFESGNNTTLVGPRFRNLIFFDNAVSLPEGPYGGQNPPPNLGDTFQPPINPSLPTNPPPPATGIIVRKNGAGRWLDDNQRDWTDYVSGANASDTQRVPGWDLPDRDLAIIDAADLSVTYATGLMNLCMAVGINPVSGQIAVVGTDALNHVRFESNLNGVFNRVQLALVHPESLASVVLDLNSHLDYATPTVPPAQRNLSIGDPRAILWSSDGSRAFVAGTGSRNLIVIDASGRRTQSQPIELGEGPCGLAWDQSRHRLYVFHRFSSSVSIVDTETLSVLGVTTLFDPTPVEVAAGRRHLYDTRRTSGLGQAACASCHVDARMDRLAWDLGNPAGDMVTAVVNHQGQIVTNAYHPMKGVMLTQTLQDIIGHEPFHWRGDRPHIESFNSTFTNLQGAAASLEPGEMRELRAFLASIRFQPNPFRNFDNTLSTNLPIPGHFALGDHLLPPGAPLPDGNPRQGLATFNLPGNFCVTCHTVPTGLGLDAALQNGAFQPIPAGPNDERHFPLAFRLEGTLRSKIAQFRNLADRVGMDATQSQSRAGFGFGHDGSIDSLTRLLQGLRIVEDQDMADLIAFLLSVPGADIGENGAPIDRTPPSAVGRQLTLDHPSRPPLLESMLALAQSPSSRVDLIAKGFHDGSPRGWFYDRSTDRFQSDRAQESWETADLLTLASTGSEITWTVVPRGAGLRLGIDRDLDGHFDRDERDANTNPADSPWLPFIQQPDPQPAYGTDVVLEAHVPPLPAPGSIAWWKEQTPIPGATGASLNLTNLQFSDAGLYSLIVTTPFQSYTSAPVQLRVEPLTVSVTPTQAIIRKGAQATFTAVTTGLGPFQYAWRFQDQPLIDAYEVSLVVSNVQVAHEGPYQVTVSNPYGSRSSPIAWLRVLANPTVVIPAQHQRVAAGQDAVFSFLIDGHPPPFGFQLTKSGLIVTQYVSAIPIGFLSLVDVDASWAGTYRIVVTNEANPSPGLTLPPVTLTVLEDTDQDGMPDEWENLHNLDPERAEDAQWDSDEDRMTNAQEYTAGTDPRDSSSVLAIGSIEMRAQSGEAILRWFAASNTTYTLQYRDTLSGQAWLKATDLVAVPARLQVAVTNRLDGAPARYYRLVTPVEPATEW